MSRKRILIFSVIAYGLFFTSLQSDAATDKELTLIYTAETHAMLYPCSCPMESDGGLTRRATLIKQLKKENPASLVLDAGNFFAGGLLDQNTQNTQLDLERTTVNLRAMELMQYDALVISDDEFNFGKEFLMDSLNRTKLNFLSANLKCEQVSPYLIKEVSGVRVGIIGLTNPAAKQKAGGLSFIEPKAAVEAAVAELKKKGVTLIILLSNLGEDEDLKIIAGLPDIALVIDGHKASKSEAFTKVGATVILHPAWQGRKLGKATLSIKDNKLSNVTAENIRVSDKFSDDPGILGILPRCFVDSDCKKEGLQGFCQNAGSSRSSCLFSEPTKVNLTVITVKECLTCNDESGINFLKRQLPGLNISYIYYPDKKATQLVQDLKITGLPAYLLGKEAVADKNFDNLKESLDAKGDYYILKSEIGGVAYFPGRKKIKGKLDVFISLYDKDSALLLDTLKEFNPELHLLAIVQGDKIDTLRAEVEAEEDLRAVCVQKYYPQGFWDYLSCRAKNINSSWWDDCALNMDAQKIKSCSRSSEGKDLLRENCSLGQGLKIMFGPAYLLDNQEIFASKGVPQKEDLKKIIKR